MPEGKHVLIVDLTGDETPSLYTAWMSGHRDLPEFCALRKIGSGGRALEEAYPNEAGLPIVVLTLGLDTNNRRVDPNGRPFERLLCVLGAYDKEPKVPVVATCFPGVGRIRRHATGTDGDVIDLSFTEQPVDRGAAFFEVPRAGGGLLKWRIEGPVTSGRITLLPLPSNRSLRLPEPIELLRRWLSWKEHDADAQRRAVYRLVAGYAWCFSECEWGRDPSKSPFIPSALIEALSPRALKALLERWLSQLAEDFNRDAPSCPRPEFRLHFYSNHAGYWLSIQKAGESNRLTVEMLEQVSKQEWSEMLTVLRDLARRFSFIGENNPPVPQSRQVRRE